MSILDIPPPPTAWLALPGKVHRVECKDDHFNEFDDDIVESRECRKCGATKPIAQFPVSTIGRNGPCRRHECVDCFNRDRRDYLRLKRSKEHEATA